MSARGAPSAPPLQGSPAGGSGGGTPPPGAPATCSRGLWEDLLRRADGDRSLVALWLAEMGFQPYQPDQPAPSSATSSLSSKPQRQGSGGEDGIKAVGGGGSSAWGSLDGARSGSPAKRPLAAASPAKAAPDADLDARAAEAGAPRHFFCPISLQIMRDPVVVGTGQTYDRPCIERWLAQGNSTCPATGQALPPPVRLVPNVALRNSIEEWSEKHAPWLLDGNRRVKPVPKEDAFGALPPPGSVADPDLAYAIRLQQEELQRIGQQRSATARGVGGPAGGDAAAGAFAGGAGAPASMRRAPSGQQQRGGGGGSGPQRGPSGAAATQPRSRLRCMSLTTLLLLAVTAAWVTLFILSLADNGWNLGDLKLNPWAGADQESLLAVGAQQAWLVTTGGQWWRLFSSPFVNAGVIQLLFNMSCLWSLGRHLEGALRPWPAPTLAALYLLGGWVGALASANLNTQYVTCGASAGVCALLGATWADQALNARRYVNHGWTVVVLLVVTAIMVVASLLPLLDPWYTAFALLTGLVAAPVPLLLPRVQRGRPKARRWLALQLVCAALVAAAAACGVAGVVLKADVGSQADFLVDGSCVTFGHWQCLPASSSPNGCRVEAQAGGPSIVFCPSGVNVTLPSGTSVAPVGNTQLITQLCDSYCILSGGAGAGAGAGGGSWGASGRPPPADAGTAAGASPPPSPGGGGDGSTEPRPAVCDAAAAAAGRC